MTRKKLLAPLTLLLLSGCATISDRSTQLIKIDTPGAEQAFCEVKRPGFRSRDWAPMTIRITKSSGLMTITCVADGNRQIVMEIKPTKEKSYWYNAFNLGLGAAYDYETDAMWKYPDEILVDFSGMKPQPMPEPEYIRLRREHPEIGGMETFRPGVAALPSDRDEATPQLRPREPGEQNDLEGGGLDDDAQMIDSGTTIKGPGAGPASAPSSPAPHAGNTLPPPVPNAGPVMPVPPPAAAQPPANTLSSGANASGSTSPANQGQ